MGPVFNFFVFMALFVYLVLAVAALRLVAREKRIEYDKDYRHAHEMGLMESLLKR